MFSKNKILSAFAAVGMMTAGAANALVINLNNTGGVEYGTKAYYGFSVASAFWEQTLTNDVVVNLDVGFGGLPPNVLGSTGSNSAGVFVGDFINALNATGTTALDAAAVMPTLVDSPMFPGLDSVEAIISGPDANSGTDVNIPLVREMDNDGSANNIVLDANTAVLKAVGLLGNDGSADGSVTFSSDFAFDFDPTDGIDAGAFDFIGVAIHEIGHALGFVSGVDIYDIVSSGLAGSGYDLDEFRIFSPLDLFRYSEDSAAQGVLDWAIDDTAFVSQYSPYFSLDGGASVFTADTGMGYFSTGRFSGDGQQASHWKDLNPPLGLLDPTVSNGTDTAVTALDLAAFDAMGWNLNIDVLNDRSYVYSGQNRFGVTSVNAPATTSILLLGLVYLGFASRKKRQA